ncbi:hypothetical protein [Halorientalis salina]|uniref:hypothetical protein n=1 Tax=Halorientalis salina TaxID=2932266 RepID=UPI0010ABF225|nr:hypothetical protein [Halorientalis salina]
MSKQRPDTGPIWTAHELSNGEYVVCERGNPDAWLRSDTVVRPPDREEHDSTDDGSYVREF